MMTDRMYCRLYKWSIRKYSQRSIKNLYFDTLQAIQKGRYDGVLLHRLNLKCRVLRGYVENAINKKV